MSLLLSASRRWALVLALATSLGACQRATYQFQPLAATPCNVLAPALLTDSLLAIGEAPEPTHLRVVRQSRRARHAARFALITKISQATRLIKLPRATAAASVAHTPGRQEPLPVVKPVRYRSRGIAVLLAVLSLTYLPLSLHNFYLGYYGRGAGAIALLVGGICLLVIGAAGFPFGESALAPFGYVGLLLLAGWFAWQLSDFMRIITGKLQPKNGEYYPRFFQLRQ